jgi:hypothetical protein
MAKKKILMMVGDFVEDCETMFAFQICACLVCQSGMDEAASSVAGIKN